MSGRWSVMQKHRGPEVIRITGARTGLTEDVRGRQRRYVISMLIRTVSVILGVTLWNVERPLAWVALVVGLLLPYVAVVIANAGRENAPGLPSSFLPPPSQPALDRSTSHVPEEPVPAESGTQDGESP
jgi:hypothetical protein